MECKCGEILIEAEEFKRGECSDCTNEREDEMRLEAEIDREAELRELGEKPDYYFDSDTGMWLL